MPCIPYGGLLSLLNDPRVEHIAGDGRIYLMHSPPQFDIIEADALRPSSAYSGNLYSDAYFRLVRDRLAPERPGRDVGPRPLASTTVSSECFHTSSAFRAFCWGATIRLRSIGQRLQERLADPRVRDHYGRARCERGSARGRVSGGTRDLRPGLRPPIAWRFQYRLVSEG